jgi:hypothetical protein
MTHHGMNDAAGGVGVDRFESRCWLDWWANSSTLLGSFEVEAVITAIEAAWTAGPAPCPGA